MTEITPLESDWLNHEQECDAHNINEAFKLAQEGTEKERKVLARYCKTSLREMGANKPIVWDKVWDAP